MTGWQYAMIDLAVVCLLPDVRLRGGTATLNRNLDKVGVLVVLYPPPVCRCCEQLQDPLVLNYFFLPFFLQK